MKDVQRFKNQVQRTLERFGINDLRFVVDNSSYRGAIIDVSAVVDCQKISIRVDASAEKRHYDEFWASVAAKTVCENLLKQAMYVTYNTIAYKLDREWDEYEGKFE